MQLPEWSNGIGKHILRIEDGKSVQGVFRGDMARFYQHWVGGRSTVCPGRETCALCQSSDPDEKKASGKFRINFLVQEGGQWVARVFEGGKRVFDQIKHLNEQAPLESVVVRIARTGKGTGTQYILSILHGNQGIVTPDLDKQLKQVPLVDVHSGLRPEEEEETFADADVG
jgi:hypothetical protein